MTEWIPVFLTADEMAIVPCTDERLKSYEAKHPQFKQFLQQFTDPFGARVSPGVLLLRSDAPETFKSIEAVSSFRDLLALSVIPGTFTGIGKPLSISMIGALIVPDARKSSLEKEYAKIRRTLPVENGEVKGKHLSETDIARLMPMLRHHDVLFEVVAIDLGLHTEEGIWENQAGRAEGMTANLTDEHHQSMIDAVWKARRELESYSLQLNIQSALIFELIRTALEHGTLFYCQRRPRELANFHWVIDASFSP